MFKANDPQSLEKGSQVLGNLFAREAGDLDKQMSHEMKLAEHNEALKASHDTLRKGHEDEEERHKKMSEAMGNEDEMKAAEVKQAAFHHAAAETEKAISAHHEAVAKEHRANADELKVRIDAMKTVATEWGGHPVVAKAAGSATTTAAPGTVSGEPGSGVAAMIAETTQALTKKALATLDSDPAVQDKIREMVLKGVADALGDKIIPDHVSGIGLPPGYRMISRVGAPTAPTGPSVDPEFEKLVSVDD